MEMPSGAGAQEEQVQRLSSDTASHMQPDCREPRGRAGLTVKLTADTGDHSCPSWLVPCPHLHFGTLSLEKGCRVPRTGAQSRSLHLWRPLYKAGAHSSTCAEQWTGQ